MRHRQQLSDEERDHRRAQDRERLRQAAEQLLSSESWQRWVRARASNSLARYSLTNQLSSRCSPAAVRRSSRASSSGSSLGIARGRGRARSGSWRR